MLLLAQTRNSLRESQRRDEARMRAERREQEDRVVLKRRRLQQQAASQALEQRQMELVDGLRHEFEDQRVFEARLMQEHQKAMDALQERVALMTAAEERAAAASIAAANAANAAAVPTMANALASSLSSKAAATMLSAVHTRSTHMRTSPSSPGHGAAVAAAQRQQDLENVRAEIEATKRALHKDMLSANLHSSRMRETTRNHVLERGWNSHTVASRPSTAPGGDARTAAAGPSAVVAQDAVSPRKSRGASLTSGGGEDEVLREAQEELAAARKMRAEFLAAVRAHASGRANAGLAYELGARLRSSSDGDSSGDLAAIDGTESADSRAVLRSSGLVRTAVRLLRPQSEAHESARTASSSSSLCLSDRARKTRTSGARALAAVELFSAVVAGKGVSSGVAAAAQPPGPLEHAWEDWTIASNKDLSNVSASRALALRMGIEVDGRRTGAGAAGAGPHRTSRRNSPDKPQDRKTARNATQTQERKRLSVGVRCSLSRVGTPSACAVSST